MGASQWNYYVPYEPDLGAALRRLQTRVFTERDYWWPYQDDAEAGLRSWPSSGADLWSDEYVQECGTHSILDMDGILADGEQPDFATVQPVTPDERQRITGGVPLTREHVPALDPLAQQRWFGRCAVLHGTGGEPAEIYFWGFSGD